MATLSPYVFKQYFDNNGDPLASGYITSKAANTAIDKNMYTTAAGDVATANPVVLSGSGRVTFWLDTGDYDFKIYDVNDVLIAQEDSVSGATGAGSGSEQTVVSIAELKALASGSTTYVTVGGYYANGDGGGGRFYWDSSSTDADDGGITISPDSVPATGRWKRIFTGWLNVRWFGATGDGTTNDSAYIQTAIDYVAGGTLDGGTVYLPSGEYSTGTTSLNVAWSGINIQGDSMGGQVRAETSIGSTIKYTGTDAAMKFTLDVTSGSAWGSSLKDMRFDGDNTGAYGIKFGNADGTLVSWWGHVENVFVTQFETAGVWLHGSQSGGNFTNVHSELNGGAGFLINTDSGGGLDNTSTTFTACRGYTNGAEGLLITGAVGIWFVGCDFEFNEYEAIKIESANGAAVDVINFIGGWVENNQQDLTRDDGYYSVLVDAGTINFSGFEFVHPETPFDGATGNKHLHVNTNAKVTLTQCRLTTTQMTQPTVDVDGSIDFHSSNPNFTASFFDVTAGARLALTVKTSHGTAAPTSGDWLVGDTVWRDGSANLAKGAPFGWFCRTSGTPGTWVEINGGRVIYNNTTETTGPYDISQFVDTVLMDATSGALTARLPDLGDIDGKEYTITKYDSSANAVTVGTQAGETMNGVTAAYLLRAQYDSITVRDIGGTWLITNSTIRPAYTGLTATNPGIQGDSPLALGLNETSTVANANDAVTAPAAFAGAQFTVVNNGANTLEIWPASGDDLGGGVDTAVTLAAAGKVTYDAYDATNWA